MNLGCSLSMSPGFKKPESVSTDTFLDILPYQFFKKVDTFRIHISSDKFRYESWLHS